MTEINGNPLCTEKQRCGNCVRDVQASVHLGIQAAKLASESLPHGQRICCTCSEQKAIELFSLTHLKNYSFRCLRCEQEVHKKKYQLRKDRGRLSKKHTAYDCVLQCGNKVSKKLARCWNCYTSNRIATKQSKAEVPVNREPPTLYPCIGECGMQLSRPDNRCTQCKRQRNQSIAANANHAIILTRVMRGIAKGTSHGAMVIGDETWSLAWRCPERGCGKPMLVNSRCYTHATGNPYTITLRPRIITRDDIPPAT